MRNSLDQLPINASPASAIISPILAATAKLFQRRTPAIPGLEVSDSTWDEWAAAMQCADIDARQGSKPAN